MVCFLLLSNFLYLAFMPVCLIQLMEQVLGGANVWLHVFINTPWASEHTGYM